MNRSHSIVAGMIALMAAGCAARLPTSTNDSLMAVIQEDGEKGRPRSDEEIERAQQALEEIPTRSRSEALASARRVAESTDESEVPNYLSDDVEYGPPAANNSAAAQQSGKKVRAQLVGQLSTAKPSATKSNAAKKPRTSGAVNENEHDSDIEPDLNALMAKAIERGNASMRSENGSRASRTQLVRQLGGPIDSDPFTLPLTAGQQSDGPPSKRRPKSSIGRKADVAVTFAEDDPPPTATKEVVSESVNGLRKSESAKKAGSSASKKQAAADKDKAPGDWSAAHRDAIAALREKIRLAHNEGEDRNEIARLETMLRLQYLLAGDRDEATKPIDDLPPAEQEYWKHQMFELADMLSDRNTGDARRYGLALHALDEATARLAELSSLSLRSAAFCKGVRDFGSIERFERPDFTRNQEVLLYVEIRNFASKKISDATFETELQGSYRVVDRSGASKAERVLPLDKQTCANRRRDYYIAYRLFIPAELDPGAYTLELTIEDKKAGKSTNTRVDFNVVSAPTQ